MKAVIELLAMILLFFSNVHLFCVFLKQIKERKNLLKEIENLKKNLAYMTKHLQELAEIDKERKKIDGDINNAKTDEEICDIINSIINVNNSKLRNDKKRD